MEVFEEISGVIPSDAYQMDRSSLLHHENRGISDIGKNHDFHQNLKISFVWRALNHYKRFVRQLRFV